MEERTRLNLWISALGVAIAGATAWAAFDKRERCVPNEEQTCQCPTGAGKKLCTDGGVFPHDCLCPNVEHRKPTPTVTQAPTPQAPAGTPEPVHATAAPLPPGPGPQPAERGPDRSVPTASPTPTPPPRSQACLGLDPTLAVEKAIVSFGRSAKWGSATYEVTLLTRNLLGTPVSLAWSNRATLIDDQGRQNKDPRPGIPGRYGNSMERYPELHFERGMKLSAGVLQPIQYTFVRATGPGETVTLSGNVVLAYEKTRGTYVAEERTLYCDSLKVR